MTSCADTGVFKVDTPNKTLTLTAGTTTSGNNREANTKCFNQYVESGMYEDYDITILGSFYNTDRGAVPPDNLTLPGRSLTLGSSSERGALFLSGTGNLSLPPTLTVLTPPDSRASVIRADEVTLVHNRDKGDLSLAGDIPCPSSKLKWTAKDSVALNGRFKMLVGGIEIVSPNFTLAHRFKLQAGTTSSLTGNVTISAPLSATCKSSCVIGGKEFISEGNSAGIIANNVQILDFNEVELDGTETSGLKYFTNVIALTDSDTDSDQKLRIGPSNQSSNPEDYVSTVTIKGCEGLNSSFKCPSAAIDFSSGTVGSTSKEIITIEAKTITLTGAVAQAPSESTGTATLRCRTPRESLLPEISKNFTNITTSIVKKTFPRNKKKCVPPPSLRLSQRLQRERRLQRRLRLRPKLRISPTLG